ncbi:MAG TPA: AAA family ATPase [Candidatus Saccharimonadales bacterium]|nr:AAA family ATPase [Candidatus Saccharimonadales bacterium]
MKLVGLAGTNGSGKDTVGTLIAAKYNYLFVSVSDLLRIELRKRGLPVIRDNTRMLSVEWRRELGVGVLVDKALELAEHSSHHYDGVVACPMRNVGEAQHLKNLGGTLIWVDADPKLRYERVQAADRGRAGEDNKTYEEFLAEEETEMHPPDPNDPTLLNGAGVKALADATILNESDLDSLQLSAEAVLGS